MEALLSLSFDNITSSSPIRIRKGLRQIEGLLAQICLSRASSLSPVKRRPSIVSLQLDAGDKKLVCLREDPAFREFWRLQESFEWNVASRVVSCLEKLLSMRNNDQLPPLTASALTLLQGLLLLHPPSRSLFSRDASMNLLLDLLEPSSAAAVQSLALLALVAALLAEPRNARCFERNDGLLAVASLFKARATAHEVKLRVVEFLYFYLMPEAPSPPPPPMMMMMGRHDAAAAATTMPLFASGRGEMERGERKRMSGLLEGQARTHSGGSEVGRESGFAVGEAEAESGDQQQQPPSDTKSTAEKTKMLGRYLANVEELVADLRDEGGLFETSGAVQVAAVC